MTYLTVVALLWGVIATERAFYWNGEYKYKECENCLYNRKELVPPVECPK